MRLDPPGAHEVNPPGARGLRPGAPALRGRGVAADRESCPAAGRQARGTRAARRPGNRGPCQASPSGRDALPRRWADRRRGGRTHAPHRLRIPSCASREAFRRFSGREGGEARPYAPSTADGLRRSAPVYPCLSLSMAVRPPLRPSAPAPTLALMSASSLSQPSSSDSQSASHVQSVLGMVAFACTIACTRYAKDADKAPSMEPRVELLRMSAERVAAFDTVSALGADAGVDARVGAERFIGSLGDLDERLRPSDWAERLIKTYLAFGLLLDFSKALVGGLDEPLRTAVLDVLEADRFDAVTAAELLDDIAADPQLAARLGLWGRRVVGEEIGTLQRVLSVYPELLGGGVDAAGLHEVLSQGATGRMRDLGLRA